MNCPHCNKVIVVRVLKDDSSSESRAASGATKLTGGKIADEIRALLEQIDDVMLTGDFEPSFIRQMRERIEEYGDRIFVSDKQMATLRKIAVSCGVD